MTKPGSSTLGQIGLDNFPTYLMNRIMGRYNASLRDEMTSLGLTTPKMRVLAILSVIETPTTGELAVYSIIENSTLSRTLDGLEDDGQIERKVDEKDGRTLRVNITPAGRKTFETIWPNMLESYETMFQGIDDAERHAFIGTLKKMLRNVRKHDF